VDKWPAAFLKHILDASDRARDLGDIRDLDLWVLQRLRWLMENHPDLVRLVAVNIWIPIVAGSQLFLAVRCRLTYTYLLLMRVSGARRRARQIQDRR
jgi:hypothetical protein